WWSWSRGAQLAIHYGGVGCGNHGGGGTTGGWLWRWHYWWMAVAVVLDRHGFGSIVVLVDFCLLAMVFSMVCPFGLANPAPMIQTFYAKDQVFNDVKLDGIVMLVDAKYAGLHLDEIKPKGGVNEAVE
ncbi:Hypothetical predicted protein, partial [Olea europaea subsp. europaea]